MNSETGDTVWEVKMRSPVRCGMLVTAGNVVFAGSPEGEFMAFNANNGEQRWKHRVGSESWAGRLPSPSMASGMSPCLQDLEAGLVGLQSVRMAHPTWHGLEARGITGPDLTDDEWRYKPTDEMIFRTLTKQRKGTLMPPFESKFAPDDIWKIIDFLRDSNRQRKARESQTQ